MVGARQDRRSGDACGSTSGTKGFCLEMVGRDKGSEKRGRHFFPLKLVFNGKAYWTETWTNHLIGLDICHSVGVFTAQIFSADQILTESVPQIITVESSPWFKP